MSMRTFCDKCDREITREPRFHILFEGGRWNDKPVTKFVNGDFCVSCMRDIDINKMLEDADKP